MPSNRFGEDYSQYEERFKEEHPRGGLVLNAVYLLLILVIAFFVSQAAGILFGWIFPADTLEATRGDLSRNYRLIYPIRGLVVLAVFYLAAYIGASKLGFSLAYEYKMPMPPKSHMVQAIFGIVVFELLSMIFIDFLPSWYLSSFLAALFGFFDPTNVFTSDLEGTTTIIKLWTYYYLWLQIILEVIFAVGSYFALRAGRRAGEANAFEARKKLLNELQH